jgi:hypothetical protein
LNERHHLPRGLPVEGLMCGRGFQSVPRSFDNAEFVRATLSMTDVGGYTIASPIRLAINRTIARARKAEAARRKSRGSNRVPIFEETRAFVGTRGPMAIPLAQHGARRRCQRVSELGFANRSLVLLLSRPYTKCPFFHQLSTRYSKGSRLNLPVCAVQEPTRKNQRI